MPFRRLFLIRNLKLVPGFIWDLPAAGSQFEIWDLERYALCSVPFAILVTASVFSFSTAGNP
jgi:hypothetical protein